MIYERALKSLPGSYKLWYNYLIERRAQLENLRVDDRAFEALNNTFERALAQMHKYPRIWLDYLGFLSSQHKVTYARHAFDRALRALPITQHDRVWPLYIQFVRQAGVPETAIRVYRRYLKVCVTSLLLTALSWSLRLLKITSTTLSKSAKLEKLHLNWQDFSTTNLSRHKKASPDTSFGCNSPTWHRRTPTR